MSVNAAALILVTLSAPAAASVLHAEAGWPGVSATFLSERSESFHLGAKASVDYALVRAISPGGAAQAVLEFSLTDRLSLVAEPGLLFHFVPDGFLFGILLPVGLRYGVPIGEATRLVFRFELPFAVHLTPLPPSGSRDLIVPLMLGAGVERQLTSDVTLTFHTRAGPVLRSVATRDGPATSSITYDFQALAGVAFSL